MQTVWNISREEASPSRRLHALSRVWSGLLEGRRGYGALFHAADNSCEGNRVKIHPGKPEKHGTDQASEVGMMYAVIRKADDAIIRQCKSKEAAIIAAQLEKEKLAISERNTITAVTLDDGGYTDIMF